MNSVPLFVERVEVLVLSVEVLVLSVEVLVLSVEVVGPQLLETAPSPILLPVRGLVE